MLHRLCPFPLAALAVLATPCPAAAQAEDAAPGPAFDLSATATIDVVSVARGAGDAGPRVLTNLDLVADADLERLAGWQGARAHVYVLDNRGARPNDLLGTLQGIDNIEVPDAGTRLFEAWVEHEVADGGASVLAGLYDVNSEFYVSDAAGLLVAPPFGIGSEFAATGPNGPSIFPSSALALRVRVPVAQGAGRVQFAALNADARTLGDFGGIDLHFREGLLLLGEGGLVEGPVRASMGGWAYTQRQGSVVPVIPQGTPRRNLARGAYAMVEADLTTHLQWFLRAGHSSGQVSPFRGGFQTGLLLHPALSTREDSAFSLGMHQAWLNRAYRAALRADNQAPAGYEQAFAASYADSLFTGLGVQGDVQWIRRAGGLADARDALVTTLRLTIGL